MAPVIAALPVILKVVAVVSSVVTMVKGLKEGNMLMAVMGGVGAFTGMSALSGTLGAGASAASSGSNLLTGAASTPGGLVVNNAAGAMGGAGGLGGAAAAAAPAASSGFSLSSLGGMGAGAAGGAGSAMAQSMASGLQAAAPQGGLLGKLGDVGSQATGVVDKALGGLGNIAELALENKDVLANVGGGLLKGYAAGKMKEEEMDWLDANRREGWARDDRAEEARRSRAASTPVRGGGSYRWAADSTAGGGA